MLLLSGITLALLLASHSSIVKGDVSNPNVYPTNSTPYNIPYKQWAQKWWQWDFAVPTELHPNANDKLEDNLNPLGRMMYAPSTMICVPASLSQNGPALGAQAGEPGISQVVKSGGLKHFRRATQTSFNIVYEAKP